MRAYKVQVFHKSAAVMIGALRVDFHSLRDSGTSKKREPLAHVLPSPDKNSHTI